MKRAPAAWWVVASDTGRNSAPWNWDDYFLNRASRRPFSWGGRSWIRSPVSHTRIETMRRGDVIVAYQARKGICGFTRVHGTAPARNAFELAPPKSAVLLDQPVALAAVKVLPNAKSSFEFVRAFKGTVHDVSGVGYLQLLGLALAFNPDQSQKLLRLYPAR